MILIEKGTFLMGSPRGELGRTEWEEQHRVTLTRSFYLSDHEVTQQEWQRQMGWNESFTKGEQLPVDYITWFDAIEYCNRLSVWNGLSPAYTMSDTSMTGVHITGGTVGWNSASVGFRLPTEAEWEYACRAGTTTAFYSGDISNPGCIPPDSSLDLVGWFCGNSPNQPQPVKAKLPNTWGLYDTHGNVYEWCWDYIDLFTDDAVIDPTGPIGGAERVLRSGPYYASLDGGAHLCRSAARAGGLPGEPADGGGLRVALTWP
jgi:formylglycine-generating enzyme required for sulfatase activity